MRKMYELRPYSAVPCPIRLPQPLGSTQPID